jgi:hypothetical protein
MIDPAILNAGAKLAATLATLYIPGSGPAVSGLAALIAAIAAYNADNGKPADYVPTHEELQAFISAREAKRITTPGERPG